MITGFATGFRWASVERAFLQLRSNWEENGRGTDKRVRDEQWALYLDEKEKKEEKTSARRETEIAPVRIPTGALNMRLRRSRAMLREWETRKKDDIGLTAEEVDRVSPSARRGPGREQSVPHSAGQKDEVPRLRHNR